MLLDSKECQKYYESLHSYETNYFGQDFEFDYKYIQHWLESPSLLYSVILADEYRQINIKGLISFLVCTKNSVDNLVNGNIFEYDLVPYSINSKDTPILYFSSLIIEENKLLLPLYRSIIKDLNNYKKNLKAPIQRAISIPCTKYGEHHLKKIGFNDLNQSKYLTKYQFMEAKSSTLRNIIWNQILD